MDTLKEIALPVISGLILSGVGWLLANVKTTRDALKDRPWAVSALTAFATTIVMSTIAWSVFVTREELRAWAPLGESENAAQYGTIKAWEEPSKTPVTPPFAPTATFTSFQGQTEYVQKCLPGWYMIGIHLTADKLGGIAADVPTASQIMCVKLIQ